MKRRDFSLQVVLSGVGLSTLLAQPALAQGNPVEGTHYTKLAQPAPVAAPAGPLTLGQCTRARTGA